MRRIPSTRMNTLNEVLCTVLEEASFDLSGREWYVPEMILRLLARGRTGRRTAIPARTVETPRRSTVNLFKRHTTRTS